MVKRLVGLFLLLSIALLHNHCTQTELQEKQLLGIWVGAYADHTQSYPHPVILDFQPNGVVTRKVIGRPVSTEHQWFIDNQTIHFDTLEFTIYSITNDSLAIGMDRKLVYRRAVQAPIDSSAEALHSIFEDSVWEHVHPDNPENSDTTYRYFDYQQVFEVTRNDYNLRCWGVDKYKTYAFLYQNGHKNNCNRSISRVQQIIQIDQVSHTLDTWNEHQKNIETYRRQSIPFRFETFKQRRFFQRCSNYPTQTHRGIINVHDKGGNYVRHYFQERYRVPADMESQNGYIALRFVINCFGETGEFQLSGMDENYQTYTFSSAITDQLLSIARKLGGWQPYQLSNGEYIDTFKTIVFKIQQGKLADISP